MTALILVALGLGGLAAGIFVGRYYVPDDRALRRSARHARSYVKTINLLLARDRDAAVEELVSVVAENVDDVEPYFALGALFRNRGEWERAIRVHQAIELREHGNRALCIRARYQLGLDFRAANMPRRATRAMEDCLEEDPKSTDVLLALCSLYEEQGRFSEAAEGLARLRALQDNTGGQDNSNRQHHLLCAAAQDAIEQDDLRLAGRLLKASQDIEPDTAHVLVVSAELAAANKDWNGAATSLRQALSKQPQMVSFLAGPLQAAEIEMNSGDENTSDSSEWGDDTNLLSPAQVGRELTALVGETSSLEPSLQMGWCCESCGRRTELFSWRCDWCRHWGNPHVDVGPASHTRASRPRERRRTGRSQETSEASATGQEPQDPALGRAGKWIRNAIDAVRGSSD